MTSTALFTDHYELTMLEAALKAGTAGQRVAFEVFTRSLPPRRRFGVFCGLGRLVEALGRFRFGAAEIDWLREAAVVTGPTLDWLGSYRFAGDVHAYPEGELYGPGSPVMTVEGTFGEAVLLETLILSILNHDSAVAAAASL
ncbi:MAG TPA: nicotinate phosphoribosyltransferase, partial [Acidimicrobiales bacterium]|nr:nicotinate phosphoribosyltransferase [Acidimicrobiales bacterium]